VHIIQRITYRRSYFTHRFILFFLWILAYVLSPQANLAAQDIQLVANKHSDYVIVVPANPTEYENKSGNEMQSYLEKISGVKIPIIIDSEPIHDKEIILGDNDHLKQLGVKTRRDKLADGGFHILTEGPHLLIYGAGLKGTLYGIYTFLETSLGCRLYTPEVEYIPKKYAVVFGQIDDLQNPAFERRYLYFPAMTNQKFCDWHKIHSGSDRHNEWGAFVHTFKDLVSAAEYFGDHPEYFSEINGKRINDGQLCLSNPDIPDLLNEHLKKSVGEKPEKRYWSVSQNDNYFACQCRECTSLSDNYKAESGLILDVVNQVARNYPDKIISTLAYQYSRSAPKKIKPEHNVNIMLCNIECNRSIPIAKDPTSESFVDDLKDWTKLTDDILIWDYVVQFRNYISPFPNLRVLQPNIRFFRDKGISMMFQQGSGKEQSEFHELRTYLIAKLLWDPDIDFEYVLDDFLTGYYGPAGINLREYIDVMHDELEMYGSDLSIYGYPYDGFQSYLSPSLLEYYSEIFDKAEKAVDYDYTLLERVIKARLPLDFAFLDISLHNPTAALSYFMEENGKWVPNPDMTTKLVRFVETAEAAGISRLQEHGTSPEDYLVNAQNFISTGMRNPLGLNKRVELITLPEVQYCQGNGQALTDGLRGMADFNYNWLGFQENDMEVVIDLESSLDISFIEARFLQYERAWIFLPFKVEFWASDDGEHFNIIETVYNPVPADRPGMVTYSFMSQPSYVKAKYLKVKASSLTYCPDWHIGAGLPCWIFVDEIVIE